jgi:ligand-binding sensor domain-containing protein
MTLLNKYCVLIILSFVITSCNGQVKNGGYDAHSKAINEDSSEKRIPLPEFGFYCGFLDSKGILWFGSRGNGVFKLEGNSFTHYTKEVGLCSDDISAISEDQNGNLWFGTPNGVCSFNGEDFASLEIPQSDTSGVWLDKVYPIVNPNQVMSILEDATGDFWFGTNGAGVYRYDGSTFTQHLSNIGMFYDGQQHNVILSIVEDLEENIWFTSLSHAGVSVFDGKGFTHYINELSDDFIRIAYCDSKGNVWIGTHGSRDGGLDLYDGNNFTAFHKTNDGISHNNVHGIYEDNSGKFWIASGTTELTTFDGEHFKLFTDKDGKTYDKIQFVIGDKKDNVWFGNRFGLWNFNGKEVIEMTRP